MDKERVISILRTYVNNDMESAEPDYVREVLYDICGCTDQELEELGLGYLIIEEVI